MVTRIGISLALVPAFMAPPAALAKRKPPLRRLTAPQTALSRSQPRTPAATTKQRIDVIGS